MQQNFRFFILLTLSLIIGKFCLLSQDGTGLTIEDMQKLTAPGRMHLVLSQFEGIWKQSIVMKSDEEPINARAKTSNEMIFGGRFLEFNSESTIYEQKFKSRQIIGYDPRNSKYFLFRIEEMGTFPIYAEGIYDSTLKKLTFYGEEPQLGKSDKIRFKIEICKERDNKYTQSEFIILGSKEFKKIETMSILEPKPEE